MGLAMTESHEKTAMFRSAQFEEDRSVHEVLRHVYDALHEKGYNPVGQIVGYLMSDPTLSPVRTPAPNYINGRTSSDEMINIQVILDI